MEPLPKVELAVYVAPSIGKLLVKFPGLATIILLLPLPLVQFNCQLLTPLGVTVKLLALRVGEGKK
jgi:hypothetical protein